MTDLFDMNTLWSEATGQDFPMGVLIARRDFVENRGSDLNILLNDLAASIEDVNSVSDVNQYDITLSPLT